jgi:hypothetical protein
MDNNGLPKLSLQYLHINPQRAKEEENDFSTLSTTGNI